MSRKKITMKIISMVVFTVGMASLVTMSMGNKNYASATEVTFQSVGNINSPADSAWEKVVTNTGMKCISKLISKIPVIGDFAAITFDQLLGYMNDSGDSADSQLDDIQAELSGITQSLNEMKILQEYSNVETILNDMQSSTESIIFRLKAIISAEKSGDLSKVKTKKDDVMQAFPQNNFASLSIKLKQYLLGGVGIQQKDIISEYYTYCKTIANNKFAAEAITMSEKCEEDLLKAYSREIFLAVAYEKIRSECSSQDKEDCYDMITKLVDDYNKVMDSYKTFKNKQFDERYDYIGDYTKESETDKIIHITGIGTQNYFGQILLNSIDINKSNQIISQFDGSTTLRQWLTSKGYDVPSNVSYFIASYGARRDLPKPLFYIGNLWNTYANVYKLDSNSKNTEEHMIYEYRFQVNIFGSIISNIDTPHDLPVAFFTN